MNKVVNLFGIDVAANLDVNWKQLVSDQCCPYTSSKCFKVRKSLPEISIGTCIVRHGRNSQPIMICPRRFLQRRQVFVDSLHLLHGHTPGNELHIVPEVAVPEGSVDYMLVSALDGRVLDFVGLEIQTLDTTGTIWPERQRLLERLGISDGSEDVSSTKGFGMNWKMTVKTILVQLHHKIGTFEHLNKKLVLVIQDKLLSYMRNAFNFGHLERSRQADPMHFHSYTLTPRADGHRIGLSERLSTDGAGIAKCLGLKVEPGVDIQRLVAAIEARISSQTLLEIL